MPDNGDLLKSILSEKFIKSLQATLNQDESDQLPAAESRDILLQVRVTAREKALIEQVVAFRRASGEPSYSVSDFLREASSLLNIFYPFTDLLKSERDWLILMLKSLSKRK